MGQTLFHLHLHSLITASGTGTILRADGTNWVATTATYPATTTSQQILYSTADSVIGQLATANSKLPATNSSGTLAMRAFSIVVQTFSGHGTYTYTPTSGMLYCIAEVLGAGGGGGATATTAANTICAGSGGGGGGYARKTISAATIGASQTITIGTGGTGGTAGNNDAGGGGTSSVGSICSATGGGAGSKSPAAASMAQSGGNGGVGSSGDINLPGQTGGIGTGFFGATGYYAIGGYSGSSYFGLGLGPIGTVSSTSTAGTVGNAVGGFGQGGSGAFNGISATQQAGGAGADGYCVITEYVIA